MKEQDEDRVYSMLSFMEGMGVEYEYVCIFPYKNNRRINQKLVKVIANGMMGTNCVEGTGMKVRTHLNVPCL